MTVYSQIKEYIFHTMIFFNLYLIFPRKILHVYIYSYGKWPFYESWL